MAVEGDERSPEDHRSSAQHSGPSQLRYGEMSCDAERRSTVKKYVVNGLIRDAAFLNYRRFRDLFAVSRMNDGADEGLNSADLANDSLVPLVIARQV